MNARRRTGPTSKIICDRVRSAGVKQHREKLEVDPKLRKPFRLMMSRVVYRVGHFAVTLPAAQAQRGSGSVGQWTGSGGTEIRGGARRSPAHCRHTSHPTDSTAAIIVAPSPACHARRSTAIGLSTTTTESARAASLPAAVTPRTSTRHTSCIPAKYSS